MSKKQILVTEITITKAGQIKLFQIKLPKNAKRIIAIDTDVMLGKTMTAELISVSLPLKK
jgi:hypothetical protein